MIAKWIIESVVCFFIAIWLYSRSVHVAVWTVGLSVVLALFFGLLVLAREYEGKKLTMPATVALVLFYAMAIIIVVYCVSLVPPRGILL